VKKIQNQFIEAYESYADSLFRHCYFRVNNREEAKDLTQDAFMKTWGYLYKGGQIKNLKAFLFSTLNNLIIDWYRKKKPEALDEEWALNIPYEGYNKDTLLEAEGKLAMSLLNKLDDKTKKVVTLRLVEGWPPKEIAEFLGESENAVSVRIHRGIASLQNIVKEQEKNYAQ
jgi:RNA polymerase sigma-70 factor, ECF subfamily